MNDQRDPFAENPYVPPTNGDATSPAQPAVPSAEQPPAPEATASNDSGGWPFSEPRATAPSESSAAATSEPASAADHETTVAMGAGSAQTSEPTTSYATEPTTVLGGSGGQPPSFATDQAAPAPRPKRRAGRLVAATTGIILLAGASGAGGAAIYDALQDDGVRQTGSSTGTALDQTATSTSTTSDVSAVAKKVLPATVQINVAGQGESGTGTGVVISADGDILTNNHVIEGAVDGGTVTVAFNDGTNAEAKIVGRDVATDIAVIKAEGVSGLPTASLGNSQDVTVGQPVVAIGSPFGLESTVTQGIVSALNRPVTPGSSATSQSSTTFPAIQTDAAINPGNSGGPLVDMSGNVIGINSAINTGGSGNGSVGLGFAIPINLVRSVSTQILEGKTVEHAQIGVTVSPATADDKITAIGAEIRDVNAGGPGDEAGLKAGDIVTQVDGNPIASSEGLVATVRGYQPGDTVTLTVLRGGKQREIKVELGSDEGATAKRQEQSQQQEPEDQEFNPFGQ